MSDNKVAGARACRVYVPDLAPGIKVPAARHTESLGLVAGKACCSPMRPGWSFRFAALLAHATGVQAPLRRRASQVQLIGVATAEPLYDISHVYVARATAVGRKFSSLRNCFIL